MIVSTLIVFCIFLNRLGLKCCIIVRKGGRVWLVGVLPIFRGNLPNTDQPCASPRANPSRSEGVFVISRTVIFSLAKVVRPSHKIAHLN